MGTHCGTKMGSHCGIPFHFSIAKLSPEGGEFATICVLILGLLFVIPGRYPALAPASSEEAPGGVVRRHLWLPYETST